MTAPQWVALLSALGVGGLLTTLSQAWIARRKTDADIHQLETDTQAREVELTKNLQIMWGKELGRLEVKVQVLEDKIIDLERRLAITRAVQVAYEEELVQLGVDPNEIADRVRRHRSIEE